MSENKQDPFAYRFRGIYGCYNPTQLVYVGSSMLGLASLEENHRYARSKAHSMTQFRLALEEEGAGWMFKWLVKPFSCQLYHIEFAEQMLIQAMQPSLNKDKHPYDTSINYGRYGDVLRLKV